MSVALLGELRLRVNDVEMPPMSPKARALMASLALRSGEVVSVDRLSDELWPGLPPHQAKRVVQVRVAEIRKLLSVASTASLVESVAPGYRLAIDHDAVDAHRFIDLLDDADRRQSIGDSLGTVTKLREALGLWRGPALTDTQPSLFLEAEAARLDELRLGAIEDRVDAELADGCHQRLVAELSSLVAAHPLRERLWCQLVLSLYRSGRQTDALRACTAVRKRLAEDVGLEPGSALRSVEAAVLAQDPALDWQPRSPSARSIVPDPFEGSPSGADLPPPPPVQYVKTADGVSLAYQVAGDGPIDLIIVPGYISELDNWWEAWSGRLVRRLSSFARLILFDKRGIGLSDRPENICIDDWVEDLRTVIDAVGSTRPAVLGVSAGGAIAMLFAATYPDRTGPLVIYAASPRYLTDGTSYPAPRTLDENERAVQAIERAWGTGEWLSYWCPSVSDDPAIRAQFGQYERRSASPGWASAYLRMLRSIDVRGVLPLISAPTLVIHPARDRAIPLGVGHYIAEHIPGASMCELDTEDHLIWFSEKVDEITDEVERFVSGHAPMAFDGRRLITALVARVERLDATATERGHELVRRHGGQPAESSEHLIASFDGPSRALDCAAALVAHLTPLGAPPKVGVSSGPTNATGDLGSVAADAKRLAAMARPGEVLTSPMVRDLAGERASLFAAVHGAAHRSFV